MSQRTLQQDFVMKHPQPRQFQAVFIKNWVLLGQSVYCVAIMFIIAIAILTGIGVLHNYYLNSYDPIIDPTEQTAISMPLGPVPANINHNIHITLSKNINKQMIDKFGTLEEDKDGTGQYLNSAEAQWIASYGQLRNSYSVPAGANVSINVSKARVPFVTRNYIDECVVVAEEEEDIVCDPSRDFHDFREFDAHIDNLAEKLMAQEILAEHNQPKNKTTLKEKFYQAFDYVFNPILSPKTQHNELELTDFVWNETEQFIYDKHKKLYTSAVNYSYLSYPLKRGLNVTEIGYNYTLSSYTNHQTQLGYGLTNFFHLGGTQYYLYQLFLRNTFKPQAGNEPPMVFGFYKQFWEETKDSGADPFTPIFLTLLIPVALYLLIPLFTYQMSQEKGDGLLSLQQMMGLKYFPRYFGDMIYQLIIATGMTAIVLAGSAIANFDYIMQTYWPVWFFIFVLFTLNIPVLSQLVASVYDSGRITALIAIFAVLVESVAAIVWSSQFYRMEGAKRIVSMWFSLIPGMAPICCMVMMSGLVITQNPLNYLKESRYFSIVRVIDGSMQSYVGYEIACSLLIGYISTVFCAFISIYIDRITPRSNGIPEHPLFFLQSLYERCCVAAKRPISEMRWKTACWALGYFFSHPKIILITQQTIDQYLIEMRTSSHKDDVDGDDNFSSSHQSTATSSTTFDYLRGKKDQSTTLMQGERSQSQQSNNIQKQVQQQFKQQNKMSLHDADLENEKQLTINGSVASNGCKPLVRLLNMRKTFPATRYTPAKQAVRGVYYTVGENECLCLLGANGCGKTTQINMLCMLFKPTTGTAYICGRSITDRRSQQHIQENLGVCPQFDVLYPTMTIKQHLRFYARIKGCAKDILEEHISDLLEAVELTDNAEKASKKLSGGMKRRLSISIALCCKPKVLIFDEPSSGLDVATRRQLWNVIIKARQGRAVLLTTHAMEEAECLATRIAIMAEGKIRCVGTAQHLQQKFGSGYQLTCCVDKDQQTNQNPVYVGTVYLSSQAEQNAHQRIVKDIGQGLILASCYQGQLVYSVPPNTVVSELFQKMEQLVQDKSSGICDWGLNQTSLESVFLKVVQQSY